MTMKEEILIILGFLWVSSCFLPVLGCDVDNFCTINQADNITVTVFNTTNGAVITGASLFIDVWRGETQITTQNAFTELTGGRYYYELSGDEINTTGKYSYNINATYGSFGYIESGKYQIVGSTPLNLAVATNITTTNIDSMMTNSTSSFYDYIVNAVWSYFNRTLTETVTANINSTQVGQIVNQTAAASATQTVGQTPRWYIDKWGNQKWGVPPA